MEETELDSGEMKPVRILRAEDQRRERYTEREKSRDLQKFPLKYSASTAQHRRVRKLCEAGG